MPTLPLFVRGWTAFRDWPAYDPFIMDSGCMGVLARSGHALADLALALTAAADHVDAVVNIAARAASELIGDCAGVRLIREDGGYGPLTLPQPEPRKAPAI